MAVSEVRVAVDHDDGFRFGCPECKALCRVYDHGEPRTWRHLDSMQFKTFLVGRVPRCPEHGVKSIDVPWANARSRFTELFEAMVIELLTLTKCQVRTARFAKIDVHSVHRLMHASVEKGLARRQDVPMEKLGIDEKSFQHGHTYATVLSDLDGKRVLDVKQDRTLEVAVDLLKQAVPRPERVKSVSMDMWEGYQGAVAKTLPRADIVHDRFHIAKYLSHAVDLTRRREHAKLVKQGLWTLERTRFLWLKNPEGHTRDQSERFAKLRTADLETSRIWALKETFKGFFASETIDQAKQFLTDWIAEARFTKNPHIVKVAGMLERHEQGLLNYVKHQITNAAAEAMNSMIQEIKTIARGFRTFQNFRIAILFFLGKLELNPRKCA